MPGEDPPPQLYPEEEPPFVDAVLNWEGWEAWSPWIWITGIGIGYLLLLFQHPQRSSFREGWALMRDKGNGWALLSVAFLSMAIAAADWSVPGPPGEPAAAPAERGAAVLLEPAVGGALELTGSVLASVAPGAAGTVRDLSLPWPAKWVLAGLVYMAGLLVLQMLYSFFTIRILMPGRSIRFGNLLELSLQHCLRIWPAAIVLTWGWPAAVLFAPEGIFRGLVSGLVFFLFAVFVFLHAAATTAEARENPLQVNVACWKRRPFSAIWFILMLAIHGILLGLLRHAGSINVARGTTEALISDLFLALLTALAVTWLTASWAVFFTRAFPSRK